MLYKHFKGGLYHVKEITKDSETLKNRVSYQSVRNGVTWSRAIEDFNDVVYVNEEWVPRFEIITEYTWEEVQAFANYFSKVCPNYLSLGNAFQLYDTFEDTKNTVVFKKNKNTNLWKITKRKGIN